jgi:hypothetical protein
VAPTGQDEWDVDVFGCYVFPPGFPYGGYHPEEWQEWWGVPIHCIAAASAHYSSVRDETVQRFEGKPKGKGKG